MSVETKTAVVVNTTQNGTWANQRGDKFFKHEVEMDNGDVGEYSSKTQEQVKFVVGEKTEYDWDTQYPKFPKIKPHYVKPMSNGMGGGFNPETEKRIVRQVCIKASCEYHSARSTSTEDVIEDAKMFEKYIYE